MSPFEKVTGKRPDLRNLKTFGCRVWVCPPGRRSDRRSNHTIKGIFLGYTATMKQIIYLDEVTKNIKTSIHGTFDEGMNDLTIPTPNARALHQALVRPLPKEEQEQRSPTELNVTVENSPFMELKEKDIHMTCEDEHLGLDIKECNERGRGYLASVSPSSSGSSALRNWRRTLAGAYIVQVNDTPTYTKTEVEEPIAVAKEEAQKSSKPAVKILFAPDSGSKPSLEAIPQLAIDQLRTVVRQVYKIEHGKALSEEDDLDDDELVALIHDTQSPHPHKPAPHAKKRRKKGKTSQFSRRQLKKGDDWK
jgi:hypothetical protein